jgi:hypothetical protein
LLGNYSLEPTTTGSEPGVGDNKGSGGVGGGGGGGEEARDGGKKQQRVGESRSFCVLIIYD